MDKEKISKKRREHVLKIDRFSPKPPIIFPEEQRDADLSKNNLKKYSEKIRGFLMDACPLCNKTSFCKEHKNIDQLMTTLLINIGDISDLYLDNIEFSKCKALAINGFLDVVDDNYSKTQNNIQNKFKTLIDLVLVAPEEKISEEDDEDFGANKNNGFSLNQLFDRDKRTIQKENTSNFDVFCKIQKNLDKLLQVKKSDELKISKNLVDKRKGYLEKWNFRINLIDLILESYENVYFKEGLTVKNIFERYEIIQKRFYEDLTELSDQLTDLCYDYVTCVKNNFSEQLIELSKKYDIHDTGHKSFSPDFIKNNVNLEQFISEEGHELVGLFRNLQNFVSLNPSTKDYHLYVGWLDNSNNIEGCGIKDEGDIVKQLGKNLLLLNETYTYIKNIKQETTKSMFGTEISEKEDIVIEMFSEYLKLKKTAYNVIFSEIKKKMEKNSDTLITSSILSDNNTFTLLAGKSNDINELKDEFLQKAKDKELEYNLLKDYNFESLEEAEKAVNQHIAKKISDNDLVGLVEYTNNSFKVWRGLRYNLKKVSTQYANQIMGCIESAVNKKDVIQTASFFYELGSERLSIKLLKGLFQKGGSYE